MTLPYILALLIKKTSAEEVLYQIAEAFSLAWGESIQSKQPEQALVNNGIAMQIYAMAGRLKLQRANESLSSQKGE